MKYKIQIIIFCLLTFLFIPFNSVVADTVKYDNSNRKVVINPSGEYEEEFETLNSLGLTRNDLVANFDSYIAIGSVALKLLEGFGTTVAPVVSVPLALYCGIKLYDTCIDKGWIDGTGSLTLGEAWESIFSDVLSNFVGKSEVVSLTSSANIPKNSNFDVPFTYTSDGVANSSYYKTVISPGSFLIRKACTINITYKVPGFYYTNFGSSYVDYGATVQWGGVALVYPRLNSLSTKRVYLENLDSGSGPTQSFTHSTGLNIPKGNYVAKFVYDFLSVNDSVLDGEKGIWTIPNTDSQVQIVVPPINPELGSLPLPGTVVKPNIGDKPILGGSIDDLVTTIPFDNSSVTDIPGTDTGVGEDTGVIEKPNTDVGEIPTTGEGLWDTLLGWLGTLFAPLTALLEWIGEMVNGILDALKNLIMPKEMDSIDFSPLYFSFADKFPFCIPFDLIRMVKEFQAEEEKPIFKVDMSGFSSGKLAKGEVGFTIDLTKFDDLILIVKTLTLVSFIFGIAFKTRDIIKG